MDEDFKEIDMLISDEESGAAPVSESEEGDSQNGGQVREEGEPFISWVLEAGYTMRTKTLQGEFEPACEREEGADWLFWLAELYGLLYSCQMSRRLRTPSWR